MFAPVCHAKSPALTGSFRERRRDERAKSSEKQSTTDEFAHSACIPFYGESWTRALYIYHGTVHPFDYFDPQKKALEDRSIKGHCTPYRPAVENIPS
jgi:hypothetical protein